MKKVICVDKSIYALTVGKEYGVLEETETFYVVRNDTGWDRPCPKGLFRPTDTYQYGQEVEVSNDEKAWNETPQTYLASNPMRVGQHIAVNVNGVPYSWQHIRPVRSVKKQVKDYITSRTEVALSEVEIDRIIQIVKEGKV